MNVDRFCNNLEATCEEAMHAALMKPGRYGGRYVARRDDDPDDFYIIKDDDPELLDDEPEIDIYAHATATCVYAIGRARYYLDQKGRVNRGYFSG